MSFAWGIRGDDLTIERKQSQAIDMGIVNFLSFPLNRVLRKILLRVEGEFRASAWEDEEDEILLS